MAVFDSGRAASPMTFLGAPEVGRASTAILTLQMNQAGRGGTEPGQGLARDSALHYTTPRPHS